jgi:hypothetical protein
MERRKWVPDVEMIADQLVMDYVDADPRPVERSRLDQGAIDAYRSQGWNDALGTIVSWQQTAADHGEEFIEDDWIELVQELAYRLSLAVREGFRC